MQPAVTITLSQLQTLKINQKVNVTASISLGKDKPKSVPVKSTQKMTMVKEDCILEDETGTANIHIWDGLIDKLKNGSTYEFQNLNVKNFQGRTYLTTTPTTIEEFLMDLKDIKFTYNANRDVITKVTSACIGDKIAQTTL